MPIAPARARFVGKDADEVQRQLASFVAWALPPTFAIPAPGIGSSSTVRRGSPRAPTFAARTELVANGQEAIRKQDRAKLEQSCVRCGQLNPVDRDEQKLGHGSGLRSR